MGVASYWRGSRAISMQYEMDAYKRDPSRPNPNAAPAPVVPRPADWGSKALARAEKAARNSIHFGQKYPAYALDFEQTVEVVMERARCGKATAEEAVRRALT